MCTNGRVQNDETSYTVGGCSTHPGIFVVLQVLITGKGSTQVGIGFIVIAMTNPYVWDMDAEAPSHPIDGSSRVLTRSQTNKVCGLDASVPGSVVFLNLEFNASMAREHVDDDLVDKMLQQSRYEHLMAYRAFPEQVSTG